MREEEEEGWEEEKEEEIVKGKGVERRSLKSPDGDSKATII